MKNSSTLSFQAKEHLLKIYYTTDCHSIGSAAKEAGIEHVKAESVVKALDKDMKFQLEAIGWAIRLKRHSFLPTQVFALDQVAAEARFSAILANAIKKDDSEQGYYDAQEWSENVSQPKPKMRLTILKGKVQALQLEILRILALIDQEIVDSTSS